MNTTQTELELQKDYMQKIRQLNDEYAGSKHRRTFSILTYGCQMNAHDSEKLEGILLEMGYEKSDDAYAADLVLHNTCCIRENAENKVYGSLGMLKHIKETRPGLKVAVCGCMMQQDSVIEKIKKTYRNVDIIFGTYNLHRFPELLYTNLETGDMIIDIWREHGEIVEDLPVVREYSHKAAINIMYGCNNFCSYCIVPYVRGRERSREPGEILREAEALVANGVKEIVLLGQNVNSYGLGLKTPVSFAELLRELDKLPGLKRIRFMTSHPKDLSDELISAISDCERVCKHIHLPLQSGSTRILQEMNRRYTKDEYLELVGKIRNIPAIQISTDIIVGFPGETEADFEDTLDVVRKTGFSSAFTFKYSKREGTPAAVMPGQISEDVVKDRFSRLLAVVNTHIDTLNSAYLGRTLTVLVDEVSKQDSEFLTGRTDGNITVHFKAGKDMIGELLDIEITECKTFYLIGRTACRS